jgi:hypothetical protein
MAFSRKISTVELRDLTAEKRCLSCSFLSRWERGRMQARTRRMLTAKSPKEDLRRSVRLNTALKSPVGVDSVPLLAIKDLREIKFEGKGEDAIL